MPCTPIVGRTRPAFTIVELLIVIVVIAVLAAITIVELLIVIVVIAVLAAITIVAFNGAQNRALQATLQADTDKARKKIMLYHAENGTFPTAINCANPTATEVCVSPSPNNTYIYNANNTTNPPSFYLSTSNGKHAYQATSSSPTEVVPNIITDGLVLHLDAANPASYPGTGTSWFDLSGNGKNGTLLAGTTYSNTNSGAMIFNGSTSNVELSNFPQIFSSSLTFSGWFYFNQSNTRDVLFGNFGENAVTVNMERHTADRLRFYWNSGVNDIFSADNIAPANQWIYINIIRDKDNNKFIFYVNGTLKSSISVTSSDISATLNLFRLGRDSRTDFTALDGKCGSIHVYNRALTQVEITQNFNALRGRYGI